MSTAVTLPFTASSGNFAIGRIFTRLADNEARVGVDVTWLRDQSPEDEKEFDAFFQKLLKETGTTCQIVASERHETPEKARRRISAFLNFGNPDAFVGEDS